MSKEKHFVLYVDDEENNLRIFKRTFKRDYEVFTAISAADGMKILAETPISLIITDQRMPEKTGVEFLKDVLSLYPDTVRIILTAFSDITDIMEAVNDCGIYRYLVKPWDREMLKRAINDGLEMSRLRSDNEGLVKKLQKSNEQLEVRVEKRTAELKKTNEELKIAKVKAEDASRAKEAFLSVMSHEIRTPLNAIIGITHMLEGADLNEDHRENVETLKFSGQNLLALINDILELSKINADKIKPELADFNLHFLLRDLIKSFEPQTKNKNLTVKTDLAENVPLFVKGDQARLTQVLINLIGNAVKFTSEGGVTVSAKVQSSDEKITDILFKISDTGIGIPNDKIEAVFESFTQAESATARKYGGTGLGLTITKKLVTLFGGKIWAESVVGQGSDFLFNVRFKTSTKREEVAKVKSAKKDLKEIHILVVEDNKVNVMLVKKFFRRWNARAEYAENGQIAVDMVRSKAYSLILMDIQMPVMNGYEASKTIRAMEDAYFKEIPIIALTASVINSQSTQIHESGITDFVIKPFAPDDLYQKIADYTASVNL